MRSVIICVDDDKWLLSVLTEQLAEWLGENYQVEKASSAQEALDIVDECIAADNEISLVISDYIMPGMKGDALLEQIKLKAPITRRIMLTGFAAIEGITNAINKAGIYRFMSKPWDNKDMMLTVLQAIHSYEQDKRAEKLSKSHKELYHKFQSLAVTLQTNLQQAMETLYIATDVRDAGTAGHAKRVAGHAVRLAKELRMTESDYKILETSAMLHDVGKLGLSDAEMAELAGVQCYTAKDVARKQGEHARLILAHLDEKILPGVMYHLEHVNGEGPYGLAAARIPLEARIISVCNYYDIVSMGWPAAAPADIFATMQNQRGRIFDDLIFDTLKRTIQ